MMKLSTSDSENSEPARGDTQNSSKRTISKASFTEGDAIEGNRTNEERCDLQIDDLAQFEKIVPRLYLAEPMSAVENLFIAKECDDVRKIVRDVMGGRFVTYFPAEKTPVGSQHANSEIYALDQLHVRCSDLLVLHSSAPSTGLGIEVEIASAACVPAIYISKEDAAQSRMMLGSNLCVILQIVYKDAGDLRIQLTNALPNLECEVLARSAKRHAIRKVISNSGLGQDLLRLRLKANLERKELARCAMISEQLLYQLECGDSDVEMLSQIQITALAGELGFTLAFTGNSPGTIYPSPLDGLAESTRASLDSLVKYIRTEELAGNPLRGERRALVDSRVIHIWSAHFEMTQLGLVGREPMDEVKSETEWRKLYSEGFF